MDFIVYVKNNIAGSTPALGVVPIKSIELFLRILIGSKKIVSRQ